MNKYDRLKQNYWIKILELNLTEKTNLISLDLVP